MKIKRKLLVLLFTICGAVPIFALYGFVCKSWNPIPTLSVLIVSFAFFDYDDIDSPLFFIAFGGVANIIALSVSSIRFIR